MWCPPPRLEHVQQLPLLQSRRVPKNWEDLNGHVNIQFYQTIYSDAAWPYLDGLGIGSDYIERTGLSMFDSEHHIRYYSELVAGDRIAVHGRTLARSEKTMWTIWFIANETRGKVCNSLEAVTVHVDLTSRKSLAWPVAVAASLDRDIERDARLDWDPPLCSSMAI